jgi:large subunit ribosomal protein L25
MAGTNVLEVMAREGTGKGAARTARRANLVPGVIYGGGTDPQPINIPYPALIKMLKAGHFMSRLLNVKVDGAENRVVCRAVQRDVVRDLPIHVDFLRLTERSLVNLMIPVEFEGHEKSPGLKRGGTITVVRPMVELRVTAGNIPDHLTVNLDGLEIGDVVKISNVALPEGARPVIADRDFVIANISAPSGLRSSDNEDGAEE